MKTKIDSSGNSHLMLTKNTLIWLFLSLGITLKAQPTISSFTPLSGPVGTTVTITGSNFHSAASNNIVYFGATKAFVSAASISSLTVTVPSGATYENISVTNNTTNLTGYSTKPFTLTFACGAPTDSTSFSTATSFGTAMWPQDAKICDFDGDGKPDIATVNGDSRIVGILRNIGTGGSINFAPATYIYGFSALYMCIQDMDGDGKTDLIVSYSGLSFSVYRNTSTIGSISFASAFDVTVSSQIQGMTSGDLDNDGKPDVVVTGAYPHGVDVFRNTSTVGTISFGPEQIYSAGYFPVGISMADIDGDTFNDLAVINNDSVVSLFRNISTAGTIAFAPRIMLNTNNDPKVITFGDIDGDSKKDMITTSYYSNTISTWLNTSTMGSISFGTENSFAGLNPRGARIDDLNGDGKPELVVADDYVSIYDNTSTIGTITFAPKINFSFIIEIPYNVSIGDLNEDGKPEIVQANTDGFSLGGQQVTILENKECLFSGIETNEEEMNSVTIYPNPILTNGFISFDNEVKNLSIKILNTLGQEIRFIKFSGKQLEIEKGELKAGVYFVQLLFEEGNSTSQKIIVR